MEVLHACHAEECETIIQSGYRHGVYHLCFSKILRSIDRLDIQLIRTAMCVLLRQLRVGCISRLGSAPRLLHQPPLLVTSTRRLCKLDMKCEIKQESAIPDCGGSFTWTFRHGGWHSSSTLAFQPKPIILTRWERDTFSRY